ncbi:9371_t:CDS:2 [Funneliformis caledonium]|uniref:9371_t:CDS:1 n=1 Tax=Funneliformis caledonium TaxID=1117310 RepID=A0A9N8V4W0_9GLOM|nr:9371_t:CDS:2 [Funneliformis caledonium]
MAKFVDKQLTAVIDNSSGVYLKQLFNIYQYDKQNNIVDITSSNFDSFSCITYKRIDIFAEDIETNMTY